jgi:hypothetical protein
MKTFIIKTRDLDKYKNKWEPVINEVINFFKKAIKCIAYYDSAPNNYRIFEILELMTVSSDNFLIVSNMLLNSEYDGDGIPLDKENLLIERIYKNYDSISISLLTSNGVMRSDILGVHANIIIYCNERFISFYPDYSSGKLYG